MALLEIVSLFVVAIALLYYYLTKDHNTWKKAGIPYEKPLPIVGNLWDVVIGKKNNGDKVTEIYRKFKGEKVVGHFNFLKPALMIRDPDILSRILTTDFQYFADNDFEVDEKLDPVLSKNMFSQRGEKWKRTRQSLTPAFTLGRVKAAHPAITAQLKTLIKWLENNPEAELKSALSKFSCEVFAAIGVGIEGHSFSEKDPILPKLGSMIFNPSLGFLFILVSFLPSIPKLLRIKMVPDEVPNFFDGVVRDLVKMREKSSEQRSDLLQYYIDLRKKRINHKYDDQNDVTEDDIVGGIVTFFVESYETIPTVISLFFYELIKNQELQNQLREEVDEVFEKNKGDPSLEEIMAMPLMETFNSELNRLYGGQFLFKRCTKDYDLDLGDGRKVHLKEGTSITLPLQGIHTDPEFWENANEFYPNHFSEEAKEYRHKNVYLPFGEGPRMCIGMRLAKVLIRSTVAYLLRNFVIQPTSKTAPKFVQDPKHFLTYLKGGVYGRFVKRSI